MYMGIGRKLFVLDASNRFKRFRWRELARNESAKDVMTELGKKDRGKHFGQFVNFLGWVRI